MVTFTALNSKQNFISAISRQSLNNHSFIGPIEANFHGASTSAFHRERAPQKTAGNATGTGAYSPSKLSAKGAYAAKAAMEAAANITAADYEAMPLVFELSPMAHRGGSRVESVAILTALGEARRRGLPFAVVGGGSGNKRGRGKPTRSPPHPHRPHQTQISAMLHVFG